MPATPTCSLCPRKCGADRSRGQTGFCGAGAVARVFRHGPHFGEEPPITGERGSGTVFFSHCTLKCFYCQNHPWSQAHKGDDLSAEALGGVLRSIAAQGCHNWNWVSPTPWLPQIREAVAPLLDEGLRLPMVCNTSGYERVETLEEFGDLIDIGLCDLRYANAETAREASLAADYVEVSRAALRWFWKNRGGLAEDGDGIASRGTICRLLILPGHAGEAVENLRWIAENLGTTPHISLMAQYTPTHKALRRAPWDRPITHGEYDLVIGELESLGFENGWVQAFEESPASSLLGADMQPGAGSVG
jgi:Uncharacterized Fe-S protein PflX, homolog of pyruvate formate lyase activating proteins